MKFRCEKALLVAGVSVASRTVSTKSAIPDLETGITVSVPAENQEPGT